jgi:hypothetical protein
MERQSENILNGIAAGWYTKTMISGMLGIHYTCVHRILAQLVATQRVIRHDKAMQSPEIYYTLAYPERWRLAGRHSRPLWIDQTDRGYSHLLPFSPTPALRIGTYTIHQFLLTPQSDPTFYLGTDDAIDEIWSRLDHVLDCRDFVPITCYFAATDPIDASAKAHGPIWLIHANGQRELLYQPPPTEPHPREVPTMQAILAALRQVPLGMTISQLAAQLVLSRSVIQRYLEILVIQHKVKKIVKSIWMEAMWQSL